jgi:LysM repeat protein
MILFPGKGLLILLLGLLCSVSAYSQQEVVINRSVNKVLLEGKVYYIHVVEPGQTLYAISRAYNISQKEISIENPGVQSGIRVGQTLKIPVVTSTEGQIDTSEQQDLQDKNTHKVKRGETFYGISKQYGISQKALQEANPSVRFDDLKPGQYLIIPVSSTAREEPLQEYDEEGFVYHKVKRKETLYSISSYYNVSIQDIRNANPELGWGGPNAGQVISIPLPQVIDQPESARDTLQADAFLYGPKDSTVEAYLYDELLEPPDNPNRTYRVAFFIPFDFQKPPPLDSLIKDEESVTRRNRIIDRYMMEEKVPQSVPFLEFFQGTLLALDSMSKSGMKLDVRYYDTRKSTARMHEILAEPGMEKTDLIIGPFFYYHLEIASAFAKKHKIPIVTPFYNDMTYLRDNPYLFQITPSIDRSYIDLAKLVASKHDYNIVYVRERDTLDREKNFLLQDLIFDGFDDYRPVEPVVFKELVLTLEHTDEIIQSLSKDRKNLIVVPSSNEALASRVVSSLVFALNEFDIELVCTPYWTEFSSIDYRYYHQLGLMFYSPFWMDYLDPKVDACLESYRHHFFAEPHSMTRQGINYGLVGYDITFYFLNALRQYGPRFILSLDKYNPQLVLDTYHFSRVGPAGGYENSKISFYQFRADMSIHEINVPELPGRNNFFTPMDNQKREYLDLTPK